MKVEIICLASAGTVSYDKCVRGGPGREPPRYDENAKEKKQMDQKKISEIRKDIESYKEAIENAEGALAEAERELDEELGKYEDVPWDEEIPEVEETKKSKALRKYHSDPGGC